MTSILKTILLRSSPALPMVLPPLLAGCTSHTPAAPAPPHAASQVLTIQEPDGSILELHPGAQDIGIAGIRQ